MKYEMHQWSSDHSKNHNTGACQNMAVQDVMLLKVFDWTMESIITFEGINFMLVTYE